MAAIIGASVFPKKLRIILVIQLILQIYYDTAFSNFSNMLLDNCSVKSNEIIRLIAKVRSKAKEYGADLDMVDGGKI